MFNGLVFHFFFFYLKVGSMSLFSVLYYVSMFIISTSMSGSTRAKPPKNNSKDHCFCQLKYILLSLYTLYFP